MRKCCIAQLRRWRRWRDGKYATPDDVKRLVLSAFAHRVAVNSRLILAQRPVEAAERVLTEILTKVYVPL